MSALIVSSASKNKRLHVFSIIMAEGGRGGVKESENNVEVCCWMPITLISVFRCPSHSLCVFPNWIVLLIVRPASRAHRLFEILDLTLFMELDQTQINRSFRLFARQNADLRTSFQRLLSVSQNVSGTCFSAISGTITLLNAFQVPILKARAERVWDAAAALRKPCWCQQNCFYRSKVWMCPFVLVIRSNYRKNSFPKDNWSISKETYSLLR